jgi:hypothetical protein
LAEKQGFWGPYQERACEDKFGAAGGEAVLPADLQQISPLHRNELHLPALRSPVEEAYLLVSLVARITAIQQTDFGGGGGTWEGDEFSVMETSK